MNTESLKRPAIRNFLDSLAKKNNFESWFEAMESTLSISDDTAYAIEQFIIPLVEEINKLQSFKDYVHNRLDEAGIEKDPESPHRAAGCRIGGRLDIVLSKQYTKDQVISAIEQATNYVGITRDSLVKDILKSL